MGDKWRAFRDTVDDTTSTIRAIFWIFGVVAVIVVFIREWLGSLDTIQIVALWVALACLGIIVLTYLLDWRRKRSIDKIPELLAQLDKLVLDYIDNYAMLNTSERLLDDLAHLNGINISELKAAAHSGDRRQAEDALSRFGQRYEKYRDHKKFQEQIMNMRLAGALMNEEHVGLAGITETREYQRIYQRVRDLRKRLPSQSVSGKINDYFYQSEALYSMLLSIKPFESLGNLRQLVPARMRASREIIFPIVEGHVNTLISAVRESIIDYKQKGRVVKYTRGWQSAKLGAWKSGNEYPSVRRYWVHLGGGSC